MTSHFINPDREHLETLIAQAAEFDLDTFFQPDGFYVQEAKQEFEQFWDNVPAEAVLLRAWELTEQDREQTQRELDLSDAMAAALVEIADRMEERGAGTVGEAFSKEELESVMEKHGVDLQAIKEWSR